MNSQNEYQNLYNSSAKNVDRNLKKFIAAKRKSVEAKSAKKGQKIK